MKSTSFTFKSNSFPSLSGEIELPDYNGKTVNKNGKRHYVTPKGTKLPSVSTVMGYDPKKLDTLEAWRKRIGHEKAAKITKESQNYGTMMHNCLEHYLSNDVDALHEEFSKKDKAEIYTPMSMFNTIKEFCDRYVEGIYDQERPIYSNRLGVAGRFDVLCKMHGVPVIMDFKNSRRPKKKEWVKGYILQSTAYAQMITEHSGVKVDWYVIPIVSFSGELQVFTGRISDNVKKMEDQVRKYYDEVVFK